MSEIPSSPKHRRVHAVSDLIRGLNGLLEDRVGRIWVMGEISGLSRPSSGHLYFSLGDADARIRAAFFRQAASRVPFELKDGLEVVVYADVSVYDKRGELQLVVRKLEPQGQGALQLAFEQLRARLGEEGLFEAEHKRPLPAFPRRVGVVTSPTSAAVRDVIEVSGLRSPSTPLLIAPTRVQGEGAEHEIVAALEAVSQEAEVDVIVLARGGGSLEDLWCFNSEALARAVFECPVPVVTGVGHETDVTLVDWVADLRAPTPSAATVAALPDGDQLVRDLGEHWRRLVAAMRALLGGRAEVWSREREVLRRLAPSARLAAQRRRMFSARRALFRAGLHQAEIRRAQLARTVARLDSLSPLGVLARGYALVRKEPEGTLLRRAEEVAVGDRLEIRLGDGEISAVVEGED
ncbi:MAG: exodeoxyribonuclease VII large subunit [Myxococcota bacterium]|nr:exodeoxyribonuclease VII large subunit [Myxococcota bacterium]